MNLIIIKNERDKDKGPTIVHLYEDERATFFADRFEVRLAPVAEIKELLKITDPKIIKVLRSLGTHWPLVYFLDEHNLPNRFYIGDLNPPEADARQYLRPRILKSTISSFAVIDDQANLETVKIIVNLRPTKLGL